jgi:hypothetical protein
MHGYCVSVLRLSEDAAYKRLMAARAARKHPAIFSMVADGRLHLTAVGRLAPYLTRENASELLAAAAGRSKSKLEELLAERFPRPDLPARVTEVPVPELRQLVPEPVGASAGATDKAPLAAACPAQSNTSNAALVPEPVEASTAARSGPASLPEERPRVALRSPERYGIQFMMGPTTHELLRRLEALLGRRLGSDDMDRAFAAGLRAAASDLERRKFGVTDRPRKKSKPARGRVVPAEVKRIVWNRDGGRCTFVSEAGKRCDARTHLQFDHIVPVARGGRSTVQNLRLRCRAHNQYEAERAYGSGFMHEIRKRSQSRQLPG